MPANYGKHPGLSSIGIKAGMKKSLFLIMSLFVVAVASAQTDGSSDVVGAADGQTGLREAPALGESVERNLPSDETYTQWVKPDDGTTGGDRVEVKKVLGQEVHTLKLPNVVPPIRFESGAADIPENYIEMLRNVLERMKDRTNVRLHFVGHTDDVKLTGAAKEKYGDNVGLSRERAGVAAEFFQKALDLPPEAISYEGVGDSQPIASNLSAEGRALNRRVEVQVWYDEIKQKLVDKEVVVSQKSKQVKICRAETVCKLRYKEGHSKRARIKNLVAPLHFDNESIEISPAFLQQIAQALHNLESKQNVVVKFVGFTDNLPLTGRAERIYGTPLGLSKAMARRVALAVQDALKLPTSAVDSDGKGAVLPIASNDSERGRALNRRIEVEFWYDDPLQDLPDEPQLCPEAAGAETVTRVYNPPTGPIKAILFENGQPVISQAYVDSLHRIMADIHDRTNVRLRFVGYTNDERLERRTAEVYGDDIGLSSARARRAMAKVQKMLGLSDAQVESEGRGYVHSDDVVNAGFVEGSSRVDVQVIYDELAALDDSDAMEITRLTREVVPKNPLNLNLMRISVDGQPVDDPGKSLADVERCTDVALDTAHIQFKMDNLEVKPRLNVTAWPTVIRYQDDKGTDGPDDLTRFRIYSNFPSFIAKAEIRLFDANQSVRDKPLAVVPVGKDGTAEWQANFDSYKAPGRELKYLLRVYDKAGNFDETSPQSISVVDQLPVDPKADPARELLDGYGDSRLASQNIPLQGGAVRVYGSDIPKGDSVWVAGRRVPVSDNGEFISEQILPAGLHTVEVAVLDAYGAGQLYLRDLELKKSDWFYVAMADVTASFNHTSGPGKLVTNNNPRYSDDFTTDGRAAFYVDGKFGDAWQLTASADSREGPLDEVFSNAMVKTPDALFRRLNPDLYYPTYGDDSTLVEGAPTSGKFYVKLKRHEDYGLWGNFKIGYYDNELARVDRALYGANAHWQTSSTTSFGAQRFAIDGFAAEPGTVAAREEFLGTDGSLYFLHHQDIQIGSERLSIEVRDKASGIVLASKPLTPSLDYDVDYLQGRIVLTQPLSSTANDNLLVRSGAAQGNPVYLVARYDYVPGFNDISTLAVGGQAHYWVNDNIRLGVTSSKTEEADQKSNLKAADITLRKSAETWVKLETSTSEGPGITSLDSNDGGFSFSSTNPIVGPDNKANAYNVETSVALQDLMSAAKGKVTLYKRELQAGYSAPGVSADKDTHLYGGQLEMPVTDAFDVRVKSDKTAQQQGLETTAHEADLNYHPNDHWTFSAGGRHDSRTDRSPVIPSTQVQGERSDVVVQAAYDSKERWRAYGFAQDTVHTSGDRDSNGRIGTGGAYRITDRFSVDGEVSGGDLGPGARIGASYLYSDRTNLYTKYALTNERADTGLLAQKGTLTSGFKTRYSDSASVYAEEQYTYGNVPTGLTHAAGIDLAPTAHINLGAKLAIGTLTDPQTGAETRRQAIGLTGGYHYNTVQLASAVEYRVDDMDQPDASRAKRTTWLFKNGLKYQINPDWRFIGKLNHAQSKSTQGEFYDGDYTEAVFGYGYRPVDNDRLNALVKYTYFYNVPTVDQVTVANTAAAYIQKSHIAAIDFDYDLTSRWTLGTKYAYRLGQVSPDRVNREFFDSRAQLVVARADWHFVYRWDALIEARQLDLPDAHDRRSGILLAINRHLGEHVKLGVGYNFTDFSDDLTDLSYNNEGYFINVVAKM